MCVTLQSPRSQESNPPGKTIEADDALAMGDVVIRENFLSLSERRKSCSNREAGAGTVNEACQQLPEVDWQGCLPWGHLPHGHAFQFWC